MATLFNIEFSELSETELREFIRKKIERRRPCYIVSPTLTHARIVHKNENFRSALKASELRLCDSEALLWMLALKRRSIRRRMAAKSLVSRLFKWAEIEGIRIYVVGDDRSMLEKIRIQYPKAVRGVSCLSHYRSSDLYDESNEVVMRDIRAAKPDILMVSLEVKRQEYWARNCFFASGATITFCVGRSLRGAEGRFMPALEKENARGPGWVWRFLGKNRYFWFCPLKDVCFLLIFGVFELNKNKSA